MSAPTTGGAPPSRHGVVAREEHGAAREERRGAPASAAPGPLPAAPDPRPASSRSAEHRLGHAAGAALGTLAALPGQLRGAAALVAERAQWAWRRSLRLRVVGTTVVLSLVVLTLLGTFLVGQIRDGLVETRRDSSLAEARVGTAEAQRNFSASESRDPSTVAGLLQDEVRRLASTGGGGGEKEVVALRAPGGASVALERAFSCAGCDVPRELRRQVQASESRQWWVYSTMPGGGGEAVPAVVVGSRVVVPFAGDYELYHFFPLDDEQATLELVRRTLAVAGLVLLILVGLIAYVVTYQVVTPVRMAARIAERLASGRLEERMHVRGEDDLARLAASFNGMAASLQSQIGQLEDLSRVQRRFVSDVSHELRTPLTTVRMAADVLHEARDDFDPATARSAELLQTQLDRFEALLADLLEISRFDAGAAVLEAERVDVRALAQRTIEATDALAQHTRTPVVLKARDQQCVAEVDARRIDRILRNLVVNAIEHGEGRKVEVTVAGDEHAVAVAVRDHGVGLKPGEAALVFNRFWRADPARARTTGGSGLGLSIALEDAHLHGGWLQAWGEPGEGSLFRLTIPRTLGGELDASPLPLRPADVRRRTGLVGSPYQRIASREGRA